MINGVAQQRNNVIPMGSYGFRSRIPFPGRADGGVFRGGMADVYYNPQDQSWYEIRDGQPVRVSGTPPRGTTVVGTPTSTGGNQSQWLSLINSLGNQALQIYQNSQQLKAAQLQQGVTGAGATGPNTGLTGLVNQVTTFATNNPLLVAAGVAGVFLLMMNPPSKRR